MPQEYTFTPKFKLIVDHLKAVRTLDEYVNGAGLKKDMRDLSNHLQRHLSHSVFHPAGWEDLNAADGCLYSSPESKSWRVVKGDVIAVEVYPAWPVQDDNESYVNLYVPPKWKKRQEFIAKVKEPQGFQHVKQYPEGELADETSIWKDLPYESYLGASGLFDSAGFLDAFREAAKTLVDMEKDIDRILARLA